MPPCSPPTAGRTSPSWHETDEQILERLVALNAERVAEEAAGTIRWLRPAFQAPGSTQAAIGLESGGAGRAQLANSSLTAPRAPRLQPPHRPQQSTGPPRSPNNSPRSPPRSNSTPQTEAQLAARFTGKGRWKSRLPDILAALEALGRARRLDDGRWLG
jgi:hypothetical protein